MQSQQLPQGTRDDQGGALVWPTFESTVSLYLTRFLRVLTLSLSSLPPCRKRYRSGETRIPPVLSHNVGSHRGTLEENEQAGRHLLQSTGRRYVCNATGSENQVDGRTAQRSGHAPYSQRSEQLFRLCRREPANVERIFLDRTKGS